MDKYEAEQERLERLRETAQHAERHSGPARRAKGAPDKLGVPPHWFVRIVAGALVLLVGVALAIGFILMKEKPAEAEITERAIRVEVVAVAPEDVQTTIRGLGSIEVLDSVDVVPEVAGRIVRVHPRLEVGEVIPAGELLFEIDPSTYEASVQEAKASAAQLRNSIARLRTQMAVDAERLKTLERTRDLAQSEFTRRKDLFEKEEVGTLSGVEQAEQGYNQAADGVDLMQQALDLYPIQIRETESALAAAAARLDMAEINLARTRVTAPFDARVKAHHVEIGQYVAPGASVLSLADDSVLEISVPLDSRDAQQWLRFAGEKPNENAAWFAAIEPVTCSIRWTGDKGNHVWQGRLARIEKFSEDTRTVTVAVRVEGENALSREGGVLPLVEGMYCSVEIPGRVLRGVYKLPHWAVGYEGTVYKVVDSRLQTTPVEVVREEGESKYVAGGLAPGDEVITTRLVNPLEGTLLDTGSGEATADEEETAS